ncbi:MAG: hypothetical protein GY801_17420 [bacterium]|nr:hypothetical protein [bacterium]
MTTIGIVVSSLDGCITRHDEEGSAFASETDQQFFHKALRTFDCCVFGSKTFLAAKAGILRNLSEERLRIVQTRCPEKYAQYQRPGMLEFSELSPDDIVTELMQRGKTRCAVLGGSEMYTQFLARQLLDELWVTLEPRIFGEGKTLVTKKCDVTLKLKEFCSLDRNTLLLKYSLPKLNGTGFSP